MSNWVDESIIHSILFGLLSVSIILIFCILYNQMWQRYFWMRNGAFIEQALDAGWRLRPTGLRPRLILESDDSCLIWKIQGCEEIVEWSKDGQVINLALDLSWDSFLAFKNAQRLTNPLD